MNSISDIEHILYINLESRTDRRNDIEKELANIGLEKKSQRFNAVCMHNGALGCSLSHLKCIQKAKQKDWDHVLICEDDIQFLSPDFFISQLNNFLSNNKDWDVVLLAGNNMPPYEKNDETSIKVTRCQTTSAYIVKKHYYDILINNFKEGIKQLMKFPYQHRFFAIDKYWFKLQERDHWYLIIPLTVTQRPGYSDIEKRNTNYITPMLDLDKSKKII